MIFTHNNEITMSYIPHNGKVMVRYNAPILLRFPKDEKPSKT